MLDDDRSVASLLALFAYVSHHICLLPLQLHLITPSFPISLYCLDLAGVRLLSPLGSQVLQTVAGAEDTSAGDATELKWEFDEDSGCDYVSFPDDQ